MKEIIAIIRPKMMHKTKETLAEMGFPSITAIPVLGRGKQRGIAEEVSVAISPEVLALGKSRGMNYIPKRQFTLVVRDEEVDTVIQAILRLNQTSNFGDGKIFVCPVDEALRIRTDETGEAAIM